MFVITVRNNLNPKAIEASYMLSAYLDTQHIENIFIDSSSLFNGTAQLPTIDYTDYVLAVVLGGDGTILHTARLVNKYNIPIVGINFGNLGFLANDGECGVIELVSRALADELIVDRRSNLQVDVVCRGEADPYDDKDIDAISDNEDTDCPFVDESSIVKLDESDALIAKSDRSFFALNECVITRGALGRTISYSLDISGVHMADVSGDGVVVATATGSTAYALAAGGPIVNPEFKGMIIQPLAPHTLSARAILTDCNDITSVDLCSNREGREATLFIDGEIIQFDAPVARVYITRGKTPTTLLYMNDHHFYHYAANTFFK